jgi:hypothetical protein
MATHRLGSGSCNLAVNCPTQWRLELGRLAFKEGISVGSFMRRAILREVERIDPAKALEFTEARRIRKSAALVGLVLWVSLAPFCGVDVDELRKPVRSVRVSRKEGFDVV